MSANEHALVTKKRSLAENLAADGAQLPCGLADEGADEGAEGGARSHEEACDWHTRQGTEKETGLIRIGAVLYRENRCVYTFLMFLQRQDNHYYRPHP
jgi:hypothetical protein